MKSLPEFDLELQDEDTPEIITGNKDTATLDDDDDDEGMSFLTISNTLYIHGHLFVVFLLVVPPNDITHESPKDGQELDIPFSNHLFNIEQYEDVEA